MECVDDAGSGVDGDSRLCDSTDHLLSVEVLLIYESHCENVIDTRPNYEPFLIDSKKTDTGATKRIVLGVGYKTANFTVAR